MHFASAQRAIPGRRHLAVKALAEVTLKCFVIMGFAPELDDVYSLIKSTVEEATVD
jgi:hypothetical protein